VIRDHVWTPRETYLSRIDRHAVVILRSRLQCGFVLNPAATSDTDHCDRPPQEHEWARGWVRGPIEATPF
jgi:hypothetical protein